MRAAAVSVIQRETLWACGQVFLNLRDRAKVATITTLKNRATLFQGGGADESAIEETWRQEFGKTLADKEAMLVMSAATRADEASERVLALLRRLPAVARA